jgi:hypothetical protein
MCSLRMLILFWILFAVIGAIADQFVPTETAVAIGFFGSLLVLAVLMGTGLHGASRQGKTDKEESDEDSQPESGVVGDRSLRADSRVRELGKPKGRARVWRDGRFWPVDSGSEENGDEVNQ